MLKATKFFLALVMVAFSQFGCKDNGQAPPELIYGRWTGSAANFDVQLNLSISGERISGSGKVVTYRGPLFDERIVREVRSSKQNDGQLNLGLIFKIPSRGEMIIGRFLSPTRFEGRYTFDDGTSFPIVLTKQE